jgi:hypothetical protein
VKSEESWVMAVAGVDIFPTPAGCFYNYNSPTVAAGCLFDPFYSLPAALLGFSPRDLRSQRSDNNPLGVIGTWLTLDGTIPTVGTEGFGENVSPARWAKMIAPRRIFGANLKTAGEDGILNTFDDRVLLAGGGG